MEPNPHHQHQQQQQNHHAYQTTTNQHHHPQIHQTQYQQPSRPPSVDSVNLGSIYSGFYPQASSVGPSSLTSANIPLTTMQQQQQPHNSFQMPGQYSQFPQQQGFNNYQSTDFNMNNNVPAAWGNFTQPPTSQQPTSLPPNLNYHYQISASAAAAAAFGLNFQQKQQQQQQQPQQNSNPGLLAAPSSNSNANIVAGSTPGPVQWPSNIGPPQSFAPAMTNQILSPTHLPPQQQQHLQQLPTMPTNQNDFVTQYYSQYYREYYQRLIAFHKYQQHQQNQKKIAPYKYNQFHTPCLFSKYNNQLIVVEPNSNVNLYGLQEVFVEHCYPHLFLQSLLFSHNNNNDNTTATTLLPFEDQQTAIDWIRVKQLNDTTMNYELKLILKLITMLFRQNGTLSGLDLSELLYELVQPNNDELEKLSQSGGSDAITKDYGRDLVSHLRQLLMRGQRRVAITFAQNNGLFDHALALSYLLSFLSSSSSSSNVDAVNLGQIIDNNLMISTIKKFITNTLSADDPLFVFYAHLIQIAISVQNSVASESGGMVPSPATGTNMSAKIDRLESFIILLANDIKFDKVEIIDKSYRNLIDLMISLLKDDYNYILPDELFNNDRFDCLLVNECLEFARFRGTRLNPRLLLRKLEFAFELFDFGFVQNAARYLTLIEDKLKDPELDWRLMIDKNSKYSKWLLPESIINVKNDEDGKQIDTKLLQNLWSYQILKIFNRINREMKQFDSPLFAVAEPKEIEKGEDPSENIDVNSKDDIDVEETDDVAGDDLDEDRTDAVSEIEDEEADVVLSNTSESSYSKHEQFHQQKQSPTMPASTSHKDNSISKQHVNSTMIQAKTPVNDKASSMSMSALSPIELNSNIQQQDSAANDQKFLSPLNSQQISQGSRRSLPNIGNTQLPRTLNTIMEIPPPPSPASEASQSIQPQKSIDSLDSSSTPSSPQKMFDMNSMKSALPDDSSKNNNEITKNTSTPAFPTFFQPPPLSTTETSQPFDFISTNGHVTAIPSYDPYFKNNELQSDNQIQSNDHLNHKNNEFLQNANNIPTPNNNNYNQYETVNKSETNISNNNNSGGESAKTSPSKTNNNNNGGLLGAILGRLKPKNQMILPDDKDPQIVYDPVTKRWIDKSSNDQSTGSMLPPPPPKIPIPSSRSVSSGLNNDQSFINNDNNNNFPNSPSLPSLQSSSPPNINGNDIPSSMMMMNGGIGNSISVPSLGSSLPSSSIGGTSSNAFRSDLRRKRYVDVFNQKTNK